MRLGALGGLRALPALAIVLLLDCQLACADKVKLCYEQELASPSNKSDANCGREWVIFNKAVVTEFWEMQEVEFYWDLACTVRLPVFEATASEQMTHPKWKENKAIAAMDGDTSTHFTANCRYLMGGCLPYQAYIGVDIGGAPVRAIHHTDEWATVRCVRIYQSPNITRQALEVQLAVSVNNSGRGNRGNTEGWRWEYLESFDALGGGLWHSRPARNQQLWRLWNGDATEKPWQVSEIIFYTDLFCTQKANGVPVVSSSFKPDGCVGKRNCDKFIPNNLADGESFPGYSHPEVMDKWIAHCSQYTGCKKEEAWLGTDFNLDPMTVKCVEIFQPSHLGQEAQPWTGKPHYTSKLNMQTWDGYTWINWAEFENLAPDVWNSTVPEPYGAYRLSNYDRITDHWVVAEVEFFEEPDCAVVGGPEGYVYDKVGGTAIDGNPSMRVYEIDAACRTSYAKCPTLAFDTLETTSWHSDCSPCLKRQAWIGLHLKRPNPDIRCFRIFQNGDRSHQSAAVELSAWDGKEWIIRRLETGVGGSSWNARPADPGSMWRLVAATKTPLAWTLVGIAFYRDESCNSAIEPHVDAEPIACGSENDVRGPPKEAFNELREEGDNGKWVTSCTAPAPGEPGCTAASAWIGLQSFKGPFDVKCVRLFQDRIRDYQTEYATLQYWNGAMWRMSSVPAFPQLGGGAWQSLPGVRGSMWRFGGQRTEKGHGVGVSELKFFTSPDCSNDTELSFEMPNFMPIISGAANGNEIRDATGYTAHLTHIGDFGIADGFKAFDGNRDTFWADLGKGWSWVGLDFTTQVADINCLMVALPGVPSFHPKHSELQGWDGKAWATKAVASNPWFATLWVEMPYVSMMGWQRRPAPERSMWRLENTYRMFEWEVKEVIFYETTTCAAGSEYKGLAISSAVTAEMQDKEGGHLLPGFAFDEDTTTLWSAECEPATYDIYGELYGGCMPGEAWIGLDVGRPVDVNCVRIMQSGLRHRQLYNATLSTWGNAGYRGAVEDGWRPQMFFDALGGDTWNVRPAQPDVLWRLAFVKRREETCETDTVMSARSWGISELKFFADDDCEVELPGPADGVDILASGSREPIGFGKRQGAINPYNPKMAFDGKTNTFWAAQCGGTQMSNRTECVEGEEFLGLDFTTISQGKPVEVRCIQAWQSRSQGKVCCDPAEDMRLERWNGRQFVPATWRHVPRDAPPIKIPAEFVKMGKCPPPQIGFGATTAKAPMEQRSRRQSDKCLIPLSAAVQLLSNPLCEKHEWCADVGYNGYCCPTEPTENAISRCCCNLLRKESVFEDELGVGMDRKIIETAPVVGIEFIIIKCTTVTPVVGVVIGLLFYFLALFPRRRDEEFGRGFYMAFVAPLRRWLKEPYKGKPAAAFIAIFVIRQPKERAIRIWPRRFLGLCLVSYLAGIFVWLVIAFAIAELAMRIFSFLGKPIAWAKSPYDPDDVDHQKKRCYIMGESYSKSTKVKIGAGLSVLAFEIGRGSGAGVVYGTKAAMDIIILRFAAKNMGVVSIDLSIPDIMGYIPPLPLDIDLIPFLDQLYYILNLSAELFEEAFYLMFVGIPRCEGPVLIFSGIWLISITAVLLRWFNYDYFGLLSATKATVLKSRPTFQQKIFAGYVKVLETLMFVTMQCVLLLFARAVILVEVNPFQSSSKWNCPYEGELAAVYIGRVFLVISAFICCGLTLACANGHFLGQQYIVSEFSKRINIELRKLDPTQPPEGGVFRWNTMLSLIPTTFGIWFDWWNVNGLLIQERAKLYAKEMNYPETCKHCGFAHLPYREVIRCTSRQVSLAYQLVPGGAIIAKACEYLNDPPFMYFGSKLKCWNERQHMEAAREGMPKKMACGKDWLKYRGTFFLAFCRDIVQPVVKRLTNIALFAIILYFTFIISKENLSWLVERTVYIVLLVTQWKGWVEFTIPVALVMLMAIGLQATKRQKPNPPSGLVRRKLAVAGQIIHSTITGTAIGLYFLKEEKRFGFSSNLCVLIGVVSGIFLGFFVVFVMRLLEQCPKSRLAGGIFTFFYSSAVGAGAGYGLGADQRMDIMIIIGVAGFVLLIPTSAICFKPVRYVKDKRPEMPSELLPLLQFPRFMSPLMGSTMACFSAKMPFKLVADKFGPHEALGISVGLGIFVGFVVGFLTDHYVDKREGQIAITFCYFIGVTVGVLVHWTLGIVGGLLAGALAATLYEREKVRKVIKKGSFEDPTFLRAKVAHSSLLQPGDLTGGDEQNIVLHSSSGKIEGWQGSWEATASGHAGGRDAVWTGAGEASPAPPPPMAIEDEASEPEDVGEDKDPPALTDRHSLSGSEKSFASLSRQGNTRETTLEGSQSMISTGILAVQQESPNQGRSLQQTATSPGSQPPATPSSSKKYSLSASVVKTARRIPPDPPRANGDVGPGS